jgi:hypothetical protein
MFHSVFATQLPIEHWAFADYLRSDVAVPAFTSGQGDGASAGSVAGSGLAGSGPSGGSVGQESGSARGRGRALRGVRLDVFSNPAVCTVIAGYLM